MYNCFFCQNPLVPFKDEKKSGNYTDHYSCYKCGDTNSSMSYIEVRKRPYCISTENNGIKNMSTASLYFKKSKLWLETFYWNDQSFSDIRADDWSHILRIHQSIDLAKYTPETLEDKIKTWILFS